jgi:hypothetical protein
VSYGDQFALLGMRCVQQISLLKLWEKLRGKHELPPFEALIPEEISRSMDKLSFSEVCPVENGYRFRIIQNGAQFDREDRQSDKNNNTALCTFRNAGSVLVGANAFIGAILRNGWPTWRARRSATRGD